MIISNHNVVGRPPRFGATAGLLPETVEELTIIILQHDALPVRDLNSTFSGSKCARCLKSLGSATAYSWPAVTPA